MKIKKKTAEILRAAVAALELHPSKFDMNDWFEYGFKRLKPKDDQDFCGTTCCFAGQIVLNSGANRELLYQYHSNFPIEFKEIFSKKIQKKLKKSWNEHDKFFEYKSAAEIIADLDGDQGSVLFFVHMWPTEFMCKYVSSKTKKTQVKILKQRVEYFIETGK